MENGQDNSARPRSTSWPVVAFVMITIGIAGLALVRTAETTGQHTLGEALLTAALVAGPFLLAEAFLKQRGPSSSRPQQDSFASDMSGRDLAEHDFADRYLRRRSFNAARLSNANFARADLNATEFDDARLTGANLTGANLRSASLKSASCYQAIFRDAMLNEADLRWANLKSADLRGASLVDADLEFADLRGTDLRYTDVRGARFEGARFSDATQFPPELENPEELLRLGLKRHPDEVVEQQPVRGTRPRFRSVHTTMRTSLAVAGAFAVIWAVPALVPNDIEAREPARTRVSGVVMERPYYRLTGTSTEVATSYRDRSGAMVDERTDGLPMVIPIDLPEEPGDTIALDISAKTIDGGTIRCEIYVGGELVSQAGSAGAGGIAICSAPAG